MTRSALVLLICASLWGQESAELQFEGSLFAPQYESGYVVAHGDEGQHQITVYGPDAKPRYSADVFAAGSPYYGAWVVDSDGVGARGYRQHLQGHIDFVDLAGKVLRTIDTGSYEPTHLTFATDHSIWAVGFVDHYETNEPDFHVVRHYSRSGEKLGESVPWTAIAGGFNAYTALQPTVLAGRRLFSSGDRIGFTSEVSYDKRIWIEVDFGGNLIRQYAFGSYDADYFVPTAMTASGGVYGRMYNAHEFKGYGILDRSKGTWRRLASHSQGSLIGADGEDLVFSRHDAGWTVLQRVAAASLL